MIPHNSSRFSIKAIVLFFAVFPSMVFSFSETELESLESSGVKTFSKKPWRRDFSWSLIRNLEIEPRHMSFSEERENKKDKSNKSRRFCDPDSKSSLCDLSSLYYKLDWTLYYSVAQWTEKYLSYSLLKNTEFFLSGSFFSNFRGGDCSYLENSDNLKSYVKCGIGDILAGWTAPVYKKDDFFSYFSFSTLAWPLSQKSTDSSLKAGIEAVISALYFIKKQEKWSQAVSSSHSLAYNHFAYPFADKDWNSYNNPFNSNQSLSLIFKQSLNKYLPVNTTLSASYSFAFNAENTYWLANEAEKRKQESAFFRPDTKEIDYMSPVPLEYQEYLERLVKKNCRAKTKLRSVITCGNRYQHLALGASASWRLDKRVYLNLSVRWKDLIKLDNPIDKEVEEKRYPSMDLNKWFFSLRASYSF